MLNEAVKQRSKRTSFHFPKDTVLELYAIMKFTYFNNVSDVIRAALHAYDDLLYFEEVGARLVVVDEACEPHVYSARSTFEYEGLRDLDKILKDATKNTRGHSKSNENSDGDSVAAPANVFFSGDAVKRIDSIREKSFINSNSQVIRIALTAYCELLAISARGDKMYVEDLDGRRFPYSPHRPWPRGDVSFAAARPGGVGGISARKFEHV